MTRHVRVDDADEQGLHQLCIAVRKVTRMPTVRMHTGAVPFRDIEVPAVSSVHLDDEGRLVFRMESHVVDRCVPYGSDTAQIAWASDEGFTLHWSTDSVAHELHSVTAALCVDVVVTAGEGADAVSFLIHTNPASGSKVMMGEADAHASRVGRLVQCIDGAGMDAFHKALKRLAADRQHTLLHSFKLVHDAVLGDDASDASTKQCVKRVADMSGSEKRGVLCGWGSQADQFASVMPFLDAFALADTANRMVGQA